MSVKDVTNLRKSGKLKEAYELALNELKEERNEWTTMSLFWVIRDYVQTIYLPNSDFSNAKICLDKMSKLLPNMLDESGIGERAYLNLLKQILPNYNSVKDVSEMSKTNPIEAYDRIIDIAGETGHKLDKVLHEDFGWIIYRYIKAKNDTLTSIEIRTLLRNYMLLQNPRPSVLHSMILTYALNFAKQHKDFSFYNFFVMWGIDNLRDEDYYEGYVDGHSIPSLISRICNTIVESGETFDVKEFLGKFSYNEKDVLEFLRQSIFWRIINLHKSNDFNNLWNTLDYYSQHYTQFGPSSLNSEILNLANRFMVDNNTYRFMPFMMKWGINNFQHADWRAVKDDKGNEYPSLAGKSAKKCFEMIRDMQYRDERKDLIIWIKGFYAEVLKHDNIDDWSKRIYATICLWDGSIEEAISIYKQLLLNMGDKYYLWSEFADCFSDDNSLRIGLLLKSKSLQKNEDYLGPIHLKLADLWLKDSYKDSAFQELEAYKKNNIKRGYNLSNEYHILCDKYNNVQPGTLKKPSLESYLEKAEDFVYSEYEWKEYAIVKINKYDDIDNCGFSNGIAPLFLVNSKRFPLLKNADLGDVFNFRCYLNNGKNIPLVIRASEKIKWSAIPIKYGIIDYINTEKSLLHIITQESILVFYNCIIDKYKRDSFVKIRSYVDKNKESTYIKIVDLETCSREEALPNMKSGVFVVDNVNIEKNLFHIVSYKSIISDIVKFEQTLIRPEVGDLLKITYCLKQNKEGKKFIRILDLVPTNDLCPDLKNTVEGRLFVKYKDDNYGYPDFALIGDYYVHSSLLRKYDIKDDCNVKAEIVLSSDNRWKVYKITEIE